jgi:hypothetical protein
MKKVEIKESDNKKVLYKDDEIAKLRRKKEREQFMDSLRKLIKDRLI